MEFNSDFFAGNRQRLAKGFGIQGVLVLSANGLVQRSSDTTFEFRQDSNLWYLTGINEPDYILVMTPEEEFLVAPKRQEHRDLWDGKIDLDKIKETSGIENLFEHFDGWNKLDRLVKKYKKIYTITPADKYIETFGFYTNPARSALLDNLKKHRSAELVDIRKDIARLRQIKQPCEIDAIKKAIEITEFALRKVTKKFDKYKFEYQMVADITGEFIRRGAQGHGYTPIVASGKNATTIHYVDVNGSIKANDLVLFDVGSEFKNYSADISRTYCLAASKRQKQVYQAVIDAQKYAFRLLKPGVKLREYENKVDEYMGVKLVELGLIKNADDKKAIKKYYPHLTSHFLGLDVHDAADYDMPLAPGMVLTVEPGIYIQEEGIGVRIEDDVLIVEGGYVNLSEAISSRLVIQ